MITNYNREVRKYICSLEEQLEQILQKKGTEDYDEMDLYISVYLGIASAASQSKNVNVIYNTLLMTGYSDLYTDLYIEEIEGRLDGERKKIYDFLKSIKSTKSLNNLFSLNPNIAIEMINSVVSFSEGSIYDKVLKLKKIPIEERQKISRVNSLYYQDLENYDIDVTLDYMLDKYNKCKGKLSDEYLLNSASVYIHNLRFVDLDAAKKLVIKLIESDIDLTCDLFDKYSVEDMDRENPKYKLIADRAKRLNKYYKSDMDDVIRNIHFCEIYDLLEAYINRKNGFDYDELCKNLTLGKKS